MHIHFVCTGNVYRSRLAETYLNSKKIANVSVSSSGIAAADNICGPICWYAQRIIEACSLVPFMYPTWRQTDADSFKGVDLVVFMESFHHKYAMEHCGYTGQRFLIWNIPDLEELHSLNLEETVQYVHTSERTFWVLRDKIDELVKNLQDESKK